MSTTIPVLPSSDLELTHSFYSGLGFERVGVWPDEYLIVRHPAPIELHFFSSHHVRASTNDHGCYVRLDDSDELHRLLGSWEESAANQGRIHPPEVTDYGLVEFALIDPDGNLIRVGAPPAVTTAG